MKTHEISNSRFVVYFDDGISTFCLFAASSKCVNKIVSENYSIYRVDYYKYAPRVKMRLLSDNIMQHYTRYPAKLNISEAQSFCAQTIGGKIAWPRSAEENNLLADLGQTWISQIEETNYSNWIGPVGQENYLHKNGSWMNSTSNHPVTCYLQRYKIVSDNGKYGPCTENVLILEQFNVAVQ